MSKDLDLIKSREIDVYGLLEIPEDSKESIIRKAYRKKALIYHPDKNPSSSAAEVFHHIGLALNVLTDPKLRSDYDTWISSRRLKELRDRELDLNTKRMKDELEKLEGDAKNETRNSWIRRQRGGVSQDKFGVQLEKLRHEGLLKRREYETRFLSKFNNETPTNDLSFNADDISNRTVKVKWKIKDGISDYFNEDILEGLLSIFGEVESVTIISRTKLDTRYDAGIVVFRDPRSAIKAVSYDFKNKIWKSTSFRKISSLLREIKWDKKYNSDASLNKDKPSLDEYTDMTLKKLRNFKRTVS